MHVITTQISVVWWCSTKEDFRTQVIASGLAAVTHATRNTWLNRHTITYWM